MSRRIACDLDGTLADMESALQFEAERLFGAGVDLHTSLRNRPDGESGAEAPDPTATTPAVRPAAAPASSGPRLTDRQYRRLWTHVKQMENFWLSLREIEPGSVARLARTASANGWEVIFLTQRPSCAGETTQIQSQRWLEAHGFELPSVYVVSGSRGKIAAALSLDAVLDDRPENCLDVATDSDATPYLVWREPAELVPPAAARLGIRVVYSIGDALDSIEAPRQPAPSPGLVDRLRLTLGI